jgi:GNAT superfamily N-acetyltransferase
LAILGDRGYRPIELTTVLTRSIDAPLSQSAPSDVLVRPITIGENKAWADASAEGWSEQPMLGDFMREMGIVMTSARNVTGFVAEIDGVIAATGALAMHEGVAMFAGASTIPAFRGRGAQNALLQARLRMAAEHGCEIAAMGAQPGSASQRNAERQGFRVAYTRTKWART